MVFGGLKVFEIASIFEVIWVVLAAVRAVEDDRQGGGFWFYDGEGCSHFIIKRDV